MTQPEAEALRKDLERRIARKDAEITLEFCPVPKIFSHMAGPHDFAVVLKVNGQEVPVNSSFPQAKVDGEIIKTPQTVIVSLEETQLSMDALKESGYDPYDQIVTSLNEHITKVLGPKPVGWFGRLRG